MQEEVKEENSSNLNEKEIERHIYELENIIASKKIFESCEFITDE